MDKKLLIIEDDRFMANGMRVRFSEDGFDLKLASNGEEALEILKTFIPRVIIVDLMMPKMDGFETLARIKAQDNLKDIPVIIASNLGQEEDIKRGKNLGAVEYVVKSNLSLDDMVAVVNKHLT